MLSIDGFARAAALGLAFVLCAGGPTFAAEGPKLPPAEYKPLPVGTTVRYDKWSYVVTRSSGHEIAVKDQNRKWFRIYAGFGLDGKNVHSSVRSMSTELDGGAKSAFESLWPLEVGKKVNVDFEESLETSYESTSRDWRMTLEVKGTAYLTIGNQRYPTYVVEEHTASDEFDAGKNRSGEALEYRATHWYNPGAGLILQTDRQDIKGGRNEGKFVKSTLVSVNYPEGTTTHALKGVAATLASRSISDASKDSAAWEKIKYSNRIADFQRYLEEFPGGVFVKLAESQMRALVARQADPDALKTQFAGIDFGQYHALVIGIDDYKTLPKLEMAVKDAKAVAGMLEKTYGFKVNMLIDPERADIIDTLDDYRETLGPKDNLLIYYAGHGWLDEETDEGYWLTRSAEKNRRSRWISNATITNTLKALSAKHVMVVADSCYSGTLTRSAADIGFRDKDYYKRMAAKQARVAMVSGGLEPVADKGGGDNSPFAAAFLDALGKNPDVMDGTRLFSEIRRPVILNANQTPEYSDVRQAGHDGGDFLFVRKR